MRVLYKRCNLDKKEVRPCGPGGSPRSVSEGGQGESEPVEGELLINPPQATPTIKWTVPLGQWG